MLFLLKPKNVICTITFLLLMLTGNIVKSQEFTIKSFYKIEKSLAARQYEKKDFNGEKCAIIKIFTNNTDILLDANSGIQDTEKKNTGEIWIWVSPGERHLKFQKEGIITKNYQIPIKINTSEVYGLDLVIKGLNEQVEVDLKTLTLRFNQEKVYISRQNRAPVLVSGKIAELKLPVGEYAFKFQKNGFIEKEQNIELNDDKLIDIDLVQGGGKVALKLPGILSLLSSPSGAEVYLNGQKTGATPFTKTVVAGEYELGIRKEFYYSYNTNITLKEEETVELPVIELKPNFGYLTITTTPDSANLILNNKDIGISPCNNKQVISGTYTIKVAKNMYHEAEKTVEIADNDKQNINIELKPAFGYLQIESEPSGADVYVENKNVGVTPWKSEKLSEGNYHVQVKKQMWADTEEFIEVKEGKPSHRILILSKNFADMEILAEGANIYINDSLMSSSTYKGQFKAGNYTVKASRHGYYDDTEKFYLNNGENKKVELKPEPMMGSVSIISMPTEAEVFLNGKLTGWKTPTVKPLQVGSYNISLRKFNYQNLEKQIDILEGENQEINLTLKLKTDDTPPPPITTDNSPVTKSKPEPTDYGVDWQKKVKRLKHQRKFWFYTMMISAGTAVYTQMEADRMYDEECSDHNNTNYNATDLHEKIELYDQISPIAYGVAGYSFLKWIIKASKHSVAKKKLNIDMAVTSKGGQMSLSYKF